MSITFVGITEDLNKYGNELDDFLGKLDIEKEIFNLNKERVMKSELLVAAFDGDEIIGLAGLERKYGFARDYILVRKDYQGKGLGKRFFLKLVAEAKENKYNIIMAIIDGVNIGALKLDRAAGYRRVGKRENLFYSFKPLSARGFSLYYLIRLTFPILNVVDVFRR